VFVVKIKMFGCSEIGLFLIFSLLKHITPAARPPAAPRPLAGFFKNKRSYLIGSARPRLPLLAWNYWKSHIMFVWGIL
jgi:hypothetical protein